MKILFQKVYSFDLDTKKPVEKILDGKGGDFQDYINELIRTVLNDDRSKRFLFPDHGTQLKTDLTSFNDGKKDVIALDIAKRLLQIEVDVQGKQLDHLGLEIQKGILLQAYVEDGNKRFYVIVKAEHTDFINETDNKKATGLPIKRKIFKSFAATIDAKNKVKYAYVSDSNAVISSYWWSRFLGLEEEFTDEHNTVRSFDIIERKILNPIREESRSDYAYLRNATVAYFRANDEFVMDDYVKELFDNYKPENNQLDVKTLSTKLRDLPDKQGFDGRFNIQHDKIKKRQIKKVQLSDQLDLVIKENIQWGEEVESVMYKGAKHLRIRTDQGYDYFDNKNQ